MSMEKAKAGELILSGPTVMNPRTRSKFLHVIDGHPHLMVLMWYIHEHKLCEPILDWLCVNRLIGTELFWFYRDHCQGSVLETIKQIVKRVEKEGNVRPIIFGKDMR